MRVLVDLESAIRGFLADVESAGSRRSAQTYRAALTRFVDFLDERERKARHLPRRRPTRPAMTAESEPLLLPAVATLEIQDAVDFARWLNDYMERERGRSPSEAMIFTYTSALQSFYSYLHREELRPNLDLEALRERLRQVRGRREHRLPRVPDDDVVATLCEAAQADPETDDPHVALIRLRDIALLECLRSSGMRVSEAVEMRRQHLNLDERSAVVRGKGGKDRVVFFSVAAVEALREYWDRRDDRQSTGHLGLLPAFARHDDSSSGKVVALSAQGVRLAVDRLRQRAGAEWPITPHRLRAWFVTHLLDGDANLAEVQGLLGHESANTTRIYTRVRARRLQDAHQPAFR